MPTNFCNNLQLPDTAITRHDWCIYVHTAHIPCRVNFCLQAANAVINMGVVFEGVCLQAISIIIIIIIIIILPLNNIPVNIDRAFIRRVHTICMDPPRHCLGMRVGVYVCPWYSYIAASFTKAKILHTKENILMQFRDVHCTVRSLSNLSKNVPNSKWSVHNLKAFFRFYKNDNCLKSVQELLS